jgi:hypothetical protein
MLRGDPDRITLVAFWAAFRGKGTDLPLSDGGAGPATDCFLPALQAETLWFVVKIPNTGDEAFQCLVSAFRLAIVMSSLALFEVARFIMDS